MSTPPRVDVLGVGISAVTRKQALLEIARWVDGRERHYVCCTGVHGVMESQAAPDLLRIHNESGLTAPDGMPMVWASWRAGARHTERVYGPDLLLDACALGVDLGWRMYFYGGKPGVPEELARRLAKRFPGLKVAGSHSPPFRPLTDEEADAEVAAINAVDPDIVWVGLSTPKQERWMAARVGHLNASVLVGVGAAFDMHAGLLPQAPAWMQERGLEWCYRLAREPRRLWRRYLYNNPRFLVKVVRRPPKLIDPRLLSS